MRKRKYKVSFCKEIIFREILIVKNKVFRFYL